MFTASDGIPKLNHEIELYNSANGQLIAWVQVPALSPKAQRSTCTTATPRRRQTSKTETGTWNSNYNGVWHLPNGTTHQRSRE